MRRHFSGVQLFATLWTMACQAPLSVRFSRRDHWSGLPCFLQGIFPAQRPNLSLLCLLHWQVGSLPLAPSVKPHLGIRKLQHHKPRKLVWGQGMLEKVTKKSMPHIPHDGQIMADRYHCYSNFRLLDFISFLNTNPAIINGLLFFCSCSEKLWRKKCWNTK